MHRYWAPETSKNDIKHRARSQDKTLWIFFFQAFDLQWLKPVTTKPKEANI